MSNDELELVQERHSQDIVRRSALRYDGIC
jgi:hypothetical protein